MKLIIFLFLVCLCSTSFIFAQGGFQLKKHPERKFSFSGFGDIYYGWQEGNANKKKSFFYNHKVNNKVRTNILLLKTDYTSPRFHATLGLMTGDYSRYVLVAEPNWAKSIHEGYMGFKPLAKQNLWIDAGLYSSFIGIEWAVSADCPTLTRSIVAENTPYYFSGLRALYTSKDKKSEFGAHILNGWQKIYLDAAQLKPSLGAHYKYKLSENLSLMYGLFYGSAYADSLNIRRFYQHANVQYNHKKWTWYATADLGVEDGYVWGSAQMISQYSFCTYFKTAARLEVFMDPHNRSLIPGKQTETLLGGASLSLDYLPTDKIFLRFEPKLLISNENNLSQKATGIMLNTSLGIKF